MHIDLDYNYKIHLIFLIIGICLGFAFYFYVYDDFLGEEAIERNWARLEAENFPIDKEFYFESNRYFEKGFFFLIPCVMAAMSSAMFFLLRTMIKAQNKILIYIIVFPYIYVLYVFINFFLVLPLLFSSF